MGVMKEFGSWEWEIKEQKMKVGKKKTLKFIFLFKKVIDCGQSPATMLKLWPVGHEFELKKTISLYTRGEGGVFDTRLHYF